MKLYKNIDENIDKNIFENFFKKYFYKKIPNSILFLFKKNYVVLRLILELSKKIIQNKEKNILNNPDLYFSIPNKNNFKRSFLIKKLFFFIKKNFYNSFYEWNLFINNKSSCFINVEEIDSIINFSFLKSYKGGNKIIIIWMVEKLTISASNKLLKILEEPPKKIYFFLIGENIKLILPTILSRTCIININKNNFNIKNIKKEFNLRLIKLFENDFILLIRTIFLLKKNIKYIYFIYPIIKKLNNMEKEEKIIFFSFLLKIFRNAYLTNIKLYDLCLFTIKKKKFKWKKFSKKINIYNIEQIMINIDLSIKKINKNFNIKYILINFCKKIKFLI